MPLKTYQDELPPINLTPMIDVVFNLIIFFMVSSSFADAEKQVDLTVPQVADSGALRATSARKTINVHRDGRITLDGRSATLSELTSRLAAERRQNVHLNVVLRGDADCPLQHVAGVFTACRKAGVSEMGIAVKLGTKEH